MKLGIVNEHFPPFAPGGAEWSTFYLARQLAVAGHQTVVITPNYGAAAQEQMSNLLVKRYPFPYKMKPGERVTAYFWLANPIVYLYSAWQIAQIIQDEKIELIHVQHKYALPGSWIAARWRKIPVLMTLRDVTLICAGGVCMHRFSPPPADCGRHRFWKGSCRREFVEIYLPTNTPLAKLRSHLISIWGGLDLVLRRQFLKRTDAVLSISQGLLETYKAAGVALPVRQFIAYNLPPPPREVTSTKKVESLGLDLADKRVILYTGKLSLGKGTPHLIEVAKTILKERQDVVFLLVGKGQKTGLLAPGILALGPQPHQVVLQLYQLADVVVLPSIVPEGSGRTLLEAMSYGKPVIGTNIGGIPELIEDGVNGYLVERGNIESLKNALLDILTDESKRLAMGKASLELVKSRYNPETNIRKLINFYREVLVDSKM